MFAVPLFLIATLAGVIPILLHLIHRQQAQQIDFSTLRFLRVSVQRTRRRRYVDDLALMATRIGVLVLIAIALAGPILLALKSLLGRGQARAVAVVLDNSASMALVDDGHPRFEQARRAAEEIMAGLHDGDAAALITTGGTPDPSQGRLFHTLGTVKQAVTQSKISYERADLAARIRQASDLLLADKLPNKEIYVITDNQEVSWQGLEESKAKEAGSQVPVVVIQINHAPALDTALREIHLASPAPVAGVTVTATVEVANTASVPQQKTLELHVDGSKEATSPTLSISAANSVKHEFQFRVDQPGVHRGEVRIIEDDASLLDNRLYFALAVDQQVPVAVLKTRRGDVPYAEDSFYLERALAPSDTGGGAFKVTTLTPEELGKEPLEGFAVVFAVNLPALDATAAGKLRDYVRTGGHLFWVCGGNVDADAYNKMNDEAEGSLLPAQLAPLREPAPGGPESWNIAELDKSYPALTPLTEPAALFNTVLVMKHYPMKPAQPAEGTVLAKLNDGQPLLMEKRVGSGTVTMLGTGIHTEWTNLPLKPLFLPLINRLIFHLGGAEAERSQITAGTPVEIPLNGAEGGPAEVEIARPSSEVLRVRIQDAKARTFRYDDTHEAGVYLLRVINAKQSKQHAFAANIDPAETEPAALSREQVLARFGKRPVLYCEKLDDLATTIKRLREGKSLADWFLALVLAGLVFEVYLANRAAALPTAPATPPLPTGAPAPRGTTTTEPEETEVSDFLKNL